MNTIHATRVLNGLLILVFFVGLNAHARPATPVNVVAATLSEIFPTAWASGSVFSHNDAQIAAQVDGRLIKVAKVGDKVKQGQLIALIDDTDLRLTFNERESEVASARYNLHFLKKEVVRLQRLAKENLSSQNELDKTTNDRNRADADLAGATVRLKQAQQQLKYTRINAPFSGVVTRRLSNLGEVVSNGTKVIQLVETDHLEITAQVPLTVYNYLKIGSPLDVKSPLGTVKAKIRAVVPVADIRSHLMELRLTLEASGWPVGLNVRVAVPNGQSQTLLAVPRDAVVLRREGNSIFRINSENKAEQLPVTLGIASGSLISVVGDINPGDKIVIRGSERLRPGQEVAIKDNNDQLVVVKESN
jgi:RND family efflux transporter MFP subunit